MLITDTLLKHGKSGELDSSLQVPYIPADEAEQARTHRRDQKMLIFLCQQVLPKGLVFTEYLC